MLEEVILKYYQGVRKDHDTPDDKLRNECAKFSIFCPWRLCPCQVTQSNFSGLCPSAGKVLGSAQKPTQTDQPIFFSQGLGGVGHHGDRHNDFPPVHFESS